MGMERIGAHKLKSKDNKGQVASGLDLSMAVLKKSLVKTEKRVPV